MQVSLRHGGGLRVLGDVHAPGGTVGDLERVGGRVTSNTLGVGLDFEVGFCSAWRCRLPCTLRDVQLS